MLSAWGSDARAGSAEETLQEPAPAVAVAEYPAQRAVVLAPGDEVIAARFPAPPPGLDAFRSAQQLQPVAIATQLTSVAREWLRFVQQPRRALSGQQRHGTGAVALVRDAPCQFRQMGVGESKPDDALLSQTQCEPIEQ